MKNIKIRPAFSMLELIFVIAILGIVASIGAELIAKVYENYIVQRAQHRSSVKTQLALNQIANRLRYAIPGTIIRRVGKTGTPELATEAMIIDTTGETYTVLQWVAADGDSFKSISSGTARRPGWSGFCDISASTGATNIPTPGSNLDLADTIIGNLSGSTKSITNATLFFPNDTNITGYDISAASGESINLSSNPSNRISERYKLAWTSYALVVESGGELNLYYNFSPTMGAAIGTAKSLLLKDVTNFKFQSSGQTTRIKLCVEEKIGNSAPIPSCKEKAVF